MSKINFSKDVLSQFLSLISFSKNKDIQNTETLLDIKKTSIQSLIVSGDRTLAVRGTLNGAFEDLGKVGVTELASFERFVNSMDSEFTGEFQKNKLVLQSKNHKISVVLQNSEYIQNKLESEKFDNILSQVNSGFSFSLSKENINEIIERFDTLSSQDLIIEGASGTINLYIKDYKTESELCSKIECESLKKNTFLIKVSKNFISLLKGIDQDVTIKLGKTESRNAIGIFFKNNYYSIEYLLALKTIEEPAVEPKTKKAKKSESTVEA